MAINFPNIMGAITTEARLALQAQVHMTIKAANSDVSVLRVALSP